MAAEGVTVSELTGNAGEASQYSQQGGGGKAARRSPPAKRPSWTQEEDEVLTDFVGKHGLGEWAAAAQVLPGRTKKQCRNRWYNALVSASKQAPWTKEEEAQLEQLHRQYGDKWTTIAKHMPDSTRSEVKNHWSRMNPGKRDASPPAASLLRQYGLEIDGERIVSIAPEFRGGSSEPTDGTSPTTSEGGHKPGTLAGERPSRRLLPGSTTILRGLGEKRVDSYGSLGGDRSSNLGANLGADVISPRGVESAGLAQQGTSASPVPAFLAADVTLPSKRFPLDPLPRLGGRQLGPKSPPKTASENSPRSSATAGSQNASSFEESLSAGDEMGGSGANRGSAERPEGSTFDWVKEWVALSQKHGTAGRETRAGGVSRMRGGPLTTEELSNNPLASFSESPGLAGLGQEGPVGGILGAFQLDFSGGQAARCGGLPSHSRGISPNPSEHQTAFSDPIETVPLGRSGLFAPPLFRRTSVPAPRAHIAPSLRRYASIDLPCVASSVEESPFPGLGAFNLSDLTISGEARKRKPQSWGGGSGDEKRFRSPKGANRTESFKGAESFEGADAHVGAGPEIQRPLAETLEAMREMYGRDLRGHIAWGRETEESVHTPGAKSKFGFAGGNQFSLGQGFASPGFAQSPGGRAFESYNSARLSPGLGAGGHNRAEKGDAKMPRGGNPSPPRGGGNSSDYATAKLTTLVTEHLNVLLEAQALQLEKAGVDQPSEMSPEDLRQLHRAHLQMKAAVHFLSTLTGDHPPGPGTEGNVLRKGSPAEPHHSRSYSDCSPGGASIAQGTRHVAQREPHVGGQFGAEIGLEVGDGRDPLRGASWDGEPVERSDGGGVFKGRFRGEGWGPLDVDQLEAAAPPHSRGHNGAQGMDWQLDTSAPAVGEGSEAPQARALEEVTATVYDPSSVAGCQLPSWSTWGHNFSEASP
ncbi:SANT/Myb domain containing protein [Klebsormidium nitens]|uniref:SANT/Myb domain containing protein n=1 Tax=Klebsormidium nitens TaxID=105231 RepID=A0A1Y1HIJ9_KLENI|nr:SANT/Myb domain containing protein [Klebsormidium nitens]|eukprot:GAQ78314.1 SANT/Myb domain containing protein [Klebsormidium nitens]